MSGTSSPRSPPPTTASTASSAFGFDQGWRRYAIGRLGWERKPDGIYLDLCAGTLDFAAALATPAAAFAGCVVGADFVPAMLRLGRDKAAPAGAGDGRRARAAVPGRVLRRRDGRMGSAEPGGPRCGTRRGRPRAQAWRPPGDPRDGAAAASRRCDDCTSSISGACCRGSAARISKHTTAYTWLPESTFAFPEPPELARRLEAQGFRRGVLRAVHGRRVRAARGDAGRGAVRTADARAKFRVVRRVTPSGRPLPPR